MGPPVESRIPAGPTFSLGTAAGVPSRFPVDRMSASETLPPAAAVAPWIGVTRAALEARLTADGLSVTHAQTLFRLLHRELMPDPLASPDALPPLRRWLESRGENGQRGVEVASEIASTDGLTRKYLLRLSDGQTIETVLMGFTGRHTACVSTQAGCAMGCVFCATGQMGFVRNLTAGEIVAQVHHVQSALRAAGHRDLRNLVLMGMGEPLNNYDAVMSALEVLCDTRGVNLGPSRVTISTVGVVPAIRRLARERRPYPLAVSLHGSTDEERAALIPAGRRWPLAELLEACREYTASTGHLIFVEWTLIAGRNDSEAHAARLGALLRGIPSHVNLIPLNPTQAFEGTATARVAAQAFQRVLREAGIPSTLRQRRGIDVAAGCGQLRSHSSS
jgi:23S rRNA (adenine2503-C2)-methyltransferase